MSTLRQFTAISLAILAALHLAGCGGGGGGGSSGNTGGTGSTGGTGTGAGTGTGGTGDTGGTGTGNDTGAALIARAMGITNSSSDITAVVIPTEQSEPTWVLMRSASGLPSTLVALLPEDGHVAAQLDENGRLVALELGEEHFEFTGYTATSVNVAYQGAGNAQSQQTLDIAQCADAADFSSLINATPAAALSALLEWYEADSYSCVVNALGSVSIADVTATLDDLRTHAEALLAADFEFDRVVKNKLVCTDSPGECASVVAQYTPELLEGLAHIDPNTQTVAGFVVDDGALQLIRSEWDPLILSETVAMDLAWRTVSCEQSLFAEVDATCTAQYVAPAGEPPLNLYGPTFVVDGITYSSSPVAEETVTGLAYPLAGAGISDGEASGSRVWYGSDACFTFRTSGEGVEDMKGGTSTTIDSFPWIRLEFVPGTQTVAVPQMRGFTYPIQYMLDPAYDRTSELRKFQWGVRLESNGSVYVNSSGYHEYMLRFSDGTTSKALWDPGTNLPADTFLGNSLRAYRGTPPASGHFCTYLEQTSVQLEPRCVETTVERLGNATRKLCYSGGMLNGDYELTSSGGVTLETGKFFNNRPAGGWTFRTDAGEVSFTGVFSEQGLQNETWDQRVNTARTQVPYTTVVSASKHNTLYRYLDGGYVEEMDGVVRLEGRLLEGHRHDWWNTYDSNGAIIEANEYDAEDLITTGQQCTSGDCVDVKESTLRQTQIFRWRACGVAFPYRIDRTWSDGKMSAQSCVKLTGTPQDYSVAEALPSCPATCS